MEYNYQTALQLHESTSCVPVPRVRLDKSIGASMNLKNRTYLSAWRGLIGNEAKELSKSCMSFNSSWKEEDDKEIHAELTAEDQT